MIVNNHGPAGLVRDWNERVSVSQDLTKTGALVKEETRELVEACAGGDRAKIAKEACDVVWTAIDVLVAHGIDFNAAFTELYRSNCSKVGPNGEISRAPDGKVLKGPWFQPADPARLLGRAA